MGKSVYVETSIISFLVAKPSRNLLAAAWQSVTVEWWEKRRSVYELFSSELMREEARQGDVDAAKKRLEVLESIPLLELTDQVPGLAKALISEGALPKTATDDAMHIALSAIHGVDYLLTWNCRHIDNAEAKPLIREIIIARGFHCSEICTPQELLGGEYDEERDS